MSRGRRCRRRPPGKARPSWARALAAKGTLGAMHALLWTDVTSGNIVLRAPIGEKRRNSLAPRAGMKERLLALKVCRWGGTLNLELGGGLRRSKRGQGSSSRYMVQETRYKGLVPLVPLGPSAPRSPSVSWVSLLITPSPRHPSAIHLHFDILHIGIYLHGGFAARMDRRPPPPPTNDHRKHFRAVH